MSALYVAWKRPDQGWWPVARLAREGSEYVFAYTRGARSAAGAGFRPLSSFPDFDEVYVSLQLFPLFQNRLLPKSRPDYQDFVDWLDLDRGEADPLVLLARSGGQRETDTLEVFSVPQPSPGPYQSTFFVQEIRQVGPAAEREAGQLSAGDALALEAEPENPHDPSASRVQLVVRGVHIGFVPRYLGQDVRALLAAADGQAQARVRRVNPAPAPAQFRVLCSLDAPWPDGFRPLANPDFEALHAFVPAGVSKSARVASELTL